MLRNATWTLSNFCRGKNPQPKWELVRPAASRPPYSSGPDALSFSVDPCSLSDRPCAHRPYQAHLLARRRGPDRRLLGHLLPLGRVERQDPGRHRVGRLPSAGRPAHAPVDLGSDARPPLGRQHCHRRRPPDAGHHCLGRALGPAVAPPVAQGGHPQRGLLDHLQHHRRLDLPDPGHHRRQHHPAPDPDPRRRRLQDQEGGLLGAQQRDERRPPGAEPDPLPRQPGLHQAPVRPPQDARQQDHPGRVRGPYLELGV
jgi:hypothetical protein